MHDIFSVEFLCESVLCRVPQNICIMLTENCCTDKKKNYFIGPFYDLNRLESLKHARLMTAAVWTNQQPVRVLIANRNHQHLFLLLVPLIVLTASFHEAELTVPTHI